MMRIIFVPMEKKTRPDGFYANYNFLHRSTVDMGILDTANNLNQNARNIRRGFYYEPANMGLHPETK